MDQSSAVRKVNAYFVGLVDDHEREGRADILYYQGLEALFAAKPHVQVYRTLYAGKVAGL